MRRILVFFIILGAFFLASACAPATASILQEGSNGAGENQVEGLKQSLSEGIGPLEITPHPAGDSRNDQSTDDLTAGNISSSGNQSATTSTSEQPGFSDSAAAGGNEVEPSINWQVYQDSTYEFSIQYPENYVILPENEPLELSDPNLEYRVRFQDLDLLEGDTAEYEIPQFTIELFDLGSQSLEFFLDSRYTAAEREAIQIGDLPGFKVFDKNLRAPNTHYYFQEKGMTYKLTPLGEYGEEMLKSFQILP